MCRSTIIGIIILLFANSCTQDALKISTSSIKEEAEIVRFDRYIFEEKYSSKSDFEELNTNNSKFSKVYFDQIINIETSNSSEFSNNLVFFRNDQTIVDAKHLVDSTFSTFRPLKEKLISGFKHFKYYFPETTTPDIYTYVSGFNEAIVIGKNFIGISLDKYLGHECRFYPLLGIHQYKMKTMIPEKVPYDAVMAWIMNSFPPNSGTPNLANEMIYHGKLMYMLEACFPESNDEIKIGFSKEQMDFCKNREGAMWTFLIEQKLLFKTDRMLLKKFIYPAPYTSPFSEASPGRTGVWLGWQIVRSYMKNNPEVTIHELMTNKSERSILNESKYFPV